MGDLRNIGPVSSSWLAEIGVESIEDLERVGAVEAFRRVRELHPDRASRNLLWALQGALMDIHWSDVPDEIKQQLVQQID